MVNALILGSELGHTIILSEIQAKILTGERNKVKRPRKEKVSLDYDGHPSLKHSGI